jgi:hypothetical protein
MSEGINTNSGQFPSTDRAHRDDDGSDIVMENTDTDNFTHADRPDFWIAVTTLTHVELLEQFQKLLAHSQEVEERSQRDGQQIQELVQQTQKIVQRDQEREVEREVHDEEVKDKLKSQYQQCVRMNIDRAEARAESRE